MSPISLSVFPWQAFPAQSNITRYHLYRLKVTEKMKCCKYGTKKFYKIVPWLSILMATQECYLLLFSDIKFGSFHSGNQTLPSPCSVILVTLISSLLLTRMFISVKLFSPSLLSLSLISIYSILHIKNFNVHLFANLA